MAKGIFEQKTISVTQLVIVMIFILSFIIPSTSFISLKLLAENNQPIISKDEKDKLLIHLEKDSEKALIDQKIYLEQKAFNEMILRSLKNMNKQLNALNTGLNKHKTDNKIHFQ